jgi:hypothetical protein
MYKFFSFVFLFLTIGALGQDLKKYDSTLKIGKVGFRVSCMNKSLTQNSLSIKPIGFKSEAREVNLELKARVISAEIDDLNGDGFADLIIYILENNGKTNLFCVSSKNDEMMQPIYFPDITNDSQLSKGYKGGDDYKLVEGVLFRKFPIYSSDTAIKTPTNKVRQIMYRVVEGDRGILNFKAFKNFELDAH